MIFTYRLDADKNPVLCDFSEYVQFLNNRENLIQKTEMKGHCISTVFLGLTSFFETSVFCGDEIIWTAMDNSFQKSIDSHEIACKMVNDKRSVDLWIKNLL